MKTTWKNGERVLLMKLKKGKVYGRNAHGKRIEACGYNRGGNWAEDDLESRRPDINWRKEQW